MTAYGKLRQPRRETEQSELRNIDILFELATYLIL